MKPRTPRRSPLGRRGAAQLISLTPPHGAVGTAGPQDVTGGPRPPVQAGQSSTCPTPNKAAPAPGQAVPPRADPDPGHWQWSNSINGCALHLGQAGESFPCLGLPNCLHVPLNPFRGHSRGSASAEREGGRARSRQSSIATGDKGSSGAERWGPALGWLIRGHTLGMQKPDFNLM